MLTVATAGQKALLAAFKKDNLNRAFLRLFQNDFSPNETSVLNDFVEADYSGYSAVRLTDVGSWSQPREGSDGKVRTEFPVITFSQDGGPTVNSIYGYFLFDPISGILLFSERFTDGPIAMVNGDSLLSIVLRFAVETEFGRA